MPASETLNDTLATAPPNGNVDEANNSKERKIQATPMWVYGALVSFVVVSYATMPDPLQPQHGEEPTIQHVFFYGWLTAICTGLGAVPLVFAPNLPPYWVGVSNGMYHIVSQNVPACCYCTLHCLNPLIWWGGVLSTFLRLAVVATPTPHSGGSWDDDCGQLFSTL
jgi:hypothetical protein